jgi:hypothetical protein
MSAGRGGKGVAVPIGMVSQSSESMSGLDEGGDELSVVLSEK